MSAENVEIVRAFQPSPDTDLTRLFRRDANPGVVQAWLDALARFVTADFVVVFHVLGPGERRGVSGLRDVWLDWLGPWESYRVGSKEYVDLGERVMVLVHDYGRRHGMAEEVKLEGGAIYDVRDGKISRAEYFTKRSDAYAAAG